MTKNEYQPINYWGFKNKTRKLYKNILCNIKNISPEAYYYLLKINKDEAVSLLRLNNIMLREWVENNYDKE